ncbi:hypothetical protein PGTUg99_020536 [Puccinia graminis f. sp. tritici]|uniref:Uncharacterized protein n=1 Tax=Puccinia graminis f. sp. tritici TaxID=56615 RepID=A0A5B0S4X5_PUCGR|nr:hypothetical protein PGTUg99_008780 [Puccinia graminis f. sp. tritici]KAA1135571.1 hypothetical protein PGTUg99_020536 [Puccinia graminis f. sp. tritici]
MRTEFYCSVVQFTSARTSPNLVGLPQSSQPSLTTDPQRRTYSTSPSQSLKFLDSPQVPYNSPPPSTATNARRSIRISKFFSSLLIQHIIPYISFPSQPHLFFFFGPTQPAFPSSPPPLLPLVLNSDYQLYQSYLPLPPRIQPI